VDNRLAIFDSFRGLSIALIVAAHTFYVEPDLYQINKFDEAFISVLSGTTGLFVFISGFFFHFVFYGRMSYVGFIKKKFLAIGVPFLLITTFFVLVGYLVLGRVPGVSISNINLYYEFLRIYFMTGLFTAHWYIPFAALLFLLTPLFNYYISLKNKSKLYLLIFLSIFPFFSGRPSDANIFHEFLYFCPFYLLGIYVSMNREFLFRFLNGHYTLFLVLMLFFVFLQIFFTGVVGNLRKDLIFSFEGIDLVFIQKIMMCLFFVGWIGSSKIKDSKFLRMLADMSFGVFFIHGIVLLLQKEIGYYEVVIISGGIYGSLNFLIVMGISLFVVYVTKRVLGRNSRFLIGY